MSHTFHFSFSLCSSTKLNNTSPPHCLQILCSSSHSNSKHNTPKLAKSVFLFIYKISSKMPQGFIFVSHKTYFFVFFPRVQGLSSQSQPIWIEKYSNGTTKRFPRNIYTLYSLSSFLFLYIWSIIYMYFLHRQRKP